MKQASRGNNTNQSSILEVIERMKKCNLEANASKSIYIAYSKKLKTLNNFIKIAQLLSEMLNNNIFPNSVIINQIIRIMAKGCKTKLALEFHTIAVDKELANTITYASTLAAIAKSKEPNSKLAIKLLQEAKGQSLVNIITYNSTLDVIAKSKEPDADLALELLQETKNQGLANIITYNNTLDTIAKSKEPDAALAGTLIDEATEQFKLTDMRTGNSLDLHNLSFGTVYFGIKRRLQEEIRNNHSISNLVLIYGKGLHSRSKQEINPLKQAVSCVVKEFSQQGVSGKENSSNPGRFDLSPQPNAANLNRFFPSKLNPNAKSFIPRNCSNTISQPPLRKM